MGSYQCKKCDLLYKTQNYRWDKKCYKHSYITSHNISVRNYDSSKKICNDCLWNKYKCTHIWKFKFFK